ncbi:hypothetical protein HDU76_000018 [Blyttiomyces sp. JEL0837]|nr:hypothetical protein HDU76_000018 [Blyttiomyces sp. JEL0837]
MWSKDLSKEARKEEAQLKKEQRLLRIERRKKLEQSRADATQLLRLTGHSTTLHPDNNAHYFHENEDNLLPWQGDPNIKIDRFDARALLDYLNERDEGCEVNLDPEVSWTVEEGEEKRWERKVEVDDDEEEQMAQFERYRDLVENERTEKSEEATIEYIDDNWNDLILINTHKAKRTPEEERPRGAAIRLNYNTSKPDNSEKDKDEVDEKDREAERILTLKKNDIMDVVFDFRDDDVDDLNIIGFQYGILGTYTHFKREKRLVDKQMEEAITKKEKEGRGRSGKSRRERDRENEKEAISRRRQMRTERRLRGDDSPDDMRRSDDDTTDSSDDDNGDVKEEFILEFGSDEEPTDTTPVDTGQTFFAPPVMRTAPALIKELDLEERILNDGIPRDANVTKTTTNDNDSMSIDPPANVETPAGDEDKVIAWKKRRSRVNKVLKEDEKSAFQLDDQDDNMTKDVAVKEQNERRSSTVDTTKKEKLVKSTASSSTTKSTLSAAEKLKLKAQMALQQQIKTDEKKEFRKEVRAENQRLEQHRRPSEPLLARRRSPSPKRMGHDDRMGSCKEAGGDDEVDEFGRIRRRSSAAVFEKPVNFGKQTRTVSAEDNSRVKDAVAGLVGSKQTEQEREKGSEKKACLEASLNNSIPQTAKVGESIVGQRQGERYEDDTSKKSDKNRLQQREREPEGESSSKHDQPRSKDKGKQRAPLRSPSPPPQRRESKSKPESRKEDRKRKRRRPSSSRSRSRSRSPSRSRPRSISSQSSHSARRSRSRSRSQSDSISDSDYDRRNYDTARKSKEAKHKRKHRRDGERRDVHRKRDRRDVDKRDDGSVKKKHRRGNPSRSRSRSVSDYAEDSGDSEYERRDRRHKDRKRKRSDEKRRRRSSSRSSTDSDRHRKPKSQRR